MSSFVIQKSQKQINPWFFVQNYCNIFGDVVFLMIDKFTDKVASYIKLKELEKRIKMND